MRDETRKHAIKAAAYDYSIRTTRPNGTESSPPVSSSATADLNAMAITGKKPEHAWTCT